MKISAQQVYTIVNFFYMLHLFEKKVNKRQIIYINVIDKKGNML